MNNLVDVIKGAHIITTDDELYFFYHTILILKFFIEIGLIL